MIRSENTKKPLTIQCIHVDYFIDWPQRVYCTADCVHYKQHSKTDICGQIFIGKLKGIKGSRLD